MSSEPTPNQPRPMPGKSTLLGRLQVVVDWHAERTDLDAAVAAFGLSFVASPTAEASADEQRRGQQSLRDLGGQSNETIQITDGR